MKNIFNKNLGSHFLRAFLDFLIPRRCLHCKEQQSFYDDLICKDCLVFLELINPNERCPKCFSIDFDSESKKCYFCALNETFLTKSAAAFDYFGPAKSLVSSLKYSNQPHLAKGAASFICVQFFRLNWPIPDIIVSVPLTFTHKMTRGYNQSFLIAKELGRLLNVEAKEILKRRLDDVSQAGLPKMQRKQLKQDSFNIKNGVDIQDKVILLIDDVSTTGSTINACASCLYEGFPKAVYGMTLCKGINT